MSGVLELRRTALAQVARGRGSKCGVAARRPLRSVFQRAVCGQDRRERGFRPTKVGSPSMEGLDVCGTAIAEAAAWRL